jgi:hypothetical protein
MGLPPDLAFHARNRDGQDRPDDRVETPRIQRRRRGGLPAGLTALAVAVASLATAAFADARTLRVGFLNTDLDRKGPGLLLRDILKAEDPDIAGVADLIAAAKLDALVISGFDYDQGLAALTAFRDRLALTGASYPHLAATPPNSGLASGADLDGDGDLRGVRDAQGFGRFAGQGGLGILSNLPITAIRDYNAFLWKDLPGALIAEDDPGLEVQRLSSVGHIAVTLDAPEGPLTLLAFHATPPVFDGPEDRNGRRNHDEAAFWLHYLNGAIGPAPEERFVLLGDANLDPLDGDGRPEAINALLKHPRLTDPAPKSAEAVSTAANDAGVNLQHRGDPALDTANWEDGPGDPGNLRVDYVLPSRDWTVAASGVAWGTPRHGLVWVDLVSGP